MKALIFLAVAILSASCEMNSQIPQIDAPSVVETKVVDVTVCDLKNYPAVYNHKLVRVSGDFSRGFEVSALYDPSCKSDQLIWVELGGKRSVGVMYCCGVAPNREREEELEVEGMKLPLTEDTIFTKYDKLLADGKNVKATVVGTFFSGKETEFPGDPPRVFYTGYGHMGASSLLVVQQVLSVERTKTKETFE